MINSLLLAISCSLDAFVASIAYGTNKVYIPFGSVQIINLICSSFLGISLFLGSFIRRFIPEKISIIISFIALLILGGRYILQSVVKRYAKCNPNSKKILKFNLFDLNFVLNIYTDNDSEKLESSTTIKSKEAFYLATALSLDSLAVGFAGGLGNINCFQVVLFSLVTDAIGVWLGLLIGRKLVEKTNLNLSWLSGLILIGLAFSKL
ncbi:sporulation membrane protein YtaF [Clostridium niameyense]|uniref:Sporulation membrane protein YtaF n=1 Tax=Clostridium niameyense TaxID=1622073 RepID=A0A6M0R7S3_9CLOT|nr:sporulation membrane protein YtaF [Clostridium niameyense]NEZ46244.1 sporulation membrane protein YtaF [Clostridium niameyense]